jgi:hypothetical protein
MQHRLQQIRIGSPGKFDDAFGLQALTHPQLMDPLYMIVWLDTGERVACVGSFQNPLHAEDYVRLHRLKMIDRKIEDELLI